MDVTLSIPDHISAEDAQAVIAAFMAAQAAATQAQAAATQEEETPATDEQVTSIDVILDDEDDDDEDDATPEPERSYVSVPSAGAIPSVTMSVGTHEGGIYGDVAALRMAEQANALRDRMREYAEAATAAAQDPDRKRPPRAEPSLVDAAVRYVIGKKHLETATYMLDTSEGGYGSGYIDDSARISRSNEEQEHIGFVISSAGRRRTPSSITGNHRGHNAWGITDLITNEFLTEFTKAQVRASVKRLTDSGFLTEDGTCGKSARYRLTDISEYVKPTDA